MLTPTKSKCLSQDCGVFKTFSATQWQLTLPYYIKCFLAENIVRSRSDSLARRPASLFWAFKAAPYISLNDFQCSKSPSPAHADLHKLFGSIQRGEYWPTLWISSRVQIHTQRHSEMPFILKTKHTQTYFSAWLL